MSMSQRCRNGLCDRCATPVATPVRHPCNGVATHTPIPPCVAPAFSGRARTIRKVLAVSQNVTKLPTAAVSYYTVNKRGRNWCVVLVTPIDGMKPLKTALYSCPDRETAVVHGKQVALRMLRPFKEAKA